MGLWHSIEFGLKGDPQLSTEVPKKMIFFLNNFWSALQTVCGVIFEK